MERHATTLVTVRALALTATLLVVAGCGSTAVEDSSQYTELLADRDSISVELDAANAELDAANAELDAANAELDAANAELDDLDGRLAAAEARLADADADVAEGDELVGYLAEFLVVDLVNRAGFSDRDADCVSQGLLADPDARNSYLLLIDPGSGADGETTEAALDQVTGLMGDCGIEVPGEPESAGPPLADVVGEVDVVGEALPPFDDGLDAAIGRRAPVLVGADYDDEQVTVDAFVEGPTMLIFLAHWCPHCNAEVPKLIQLRDEERIPDGVNVVAVSTLVNPDRPNYPPDRWLADAGWTFPTLVDEPGPGGGFVAADAYGLRSVPYTILLDADGVVTARWAGERPVEMIESALRSLEP